MNIQLYTPYNKQVEVHQGCADETYLIDVVNASRQTGKTMLGQNQAVKWCLENKNITVMWVSPTSSQTTKVYKNIVKTLGNAPFVDSYKQTQGDTEINFTNGSVIKFKSAAAEDNLRGETINYMILDEAAFIKEATFLEILLPMLNVAGRKLLIISTPKGKSNWFHKYYHKGKTGVKGFKAYYFNCYTNPFANPDIIEIAKANMPELMFRQEYLAEFVEGGSIIPNIEELCSGIMRHLPEKGKKYYAGLDLALRNDYTVFTVVDNEGNLVYYDRFNKMSAPELKERIVKNIKLWNPENTMIELNNMGGVIYDDLRELYGLKKLQGFNTSNKSKNEIINKLLSQFSNKTIILPEDEILKAELEVFEMKISSTGTIRFAAAEGFHDDIVMSLAIAQEARRNGNKHRFGLKIVS